MKKVLLLLADAFETFEASVFIDIIGWNGAFGEPKTELRSCGRTKEVKSTFGQCMIVDHLIEEINVDDWDALAIPGGFGEYGFYDDAYQPDFLELIRAFRSKGRPIASICVAALPVGKSGILKGKRGTCYHNPVRRDALRSFGVDVVDEPIVEEDGIITSWNPSTAADVAFRLLEMLTGKENAGKIRELMGFV